MARHRRFGALRRLPSGRWQSSYVAPDGLRRLAPRTFTLKGDASAWLAERHVEIVQGQWLDPDRGRVPLSAYAGKWIIEHRISPRTRDLYESVHRLHIEPFLGQRRLADIGPETVRAWRAELLATGRSQGTAAKAYRLLRAIMNTAVDDGRIRRNPCRLKGADVEPTSERPVATVPQVYALAEAIGPHYRAFILTAALTSLRWGELVALRRRDVDLDEGLITVRRSLAEVKGQFIEGPPKCGSVRTVAMPEVLVGELRAHLGRVDSRDPDERVFVGERGATPRRGNWRANVDWRRAVQTAGLPRGFHFHDLRHTGNHLVAISGATTRELMQRMGHSSMRAALIYQHATDGRARDLAERLNALVTSHQLVPENESGCTSVARSDTAMA